MSQSKFSFGCVKIQKKITRRSHVALDVDGLPGWISKTAKPYDWLGVGDFVLGADGLRLASLTTGLQACRLDTSLIFFPSPLSGVPVRSSGDNYGSTDTYTSSAF